MRKLKKTGVKINSLIGKAIAEHDLIKDGDKILVAVSGGKDSLTLLQMLKKIQGWAPVKFELFAAHVVTDFHCASCTHKETLVDFFNKTETPYFFKKIKVLDEEGKTDCFWCSWNKRKALFETAKENGCNKIAFGHHKDDIAETILLNMFYKGEMSSMKANQEMFGGEITIIRPLCFVEESLIETFAKENEYPSKLCKCPFGAKSKRKLIKGILSEIQSKSPGVNISTNITRSISRIKKDYI